MAYATRPVRPTFTLSDVFGPEPVFNPRASFRRYGWLPPEASVLDSFTGGFLPAAGATPTICFAGVATGAGLDLLAEAGLPQADTLLTYTSQAEYYQRLADAIASGRPIVVQHVHRLPEIPASSYWVARDLLAYLNNKGNLADLVPAEALPPRRLVDVEELRTQADRPLVVKAVSDRTSGGGGAVIVARSPDDLRQAARKFAGCRRVVVEEFLDFQENFCLNFVVTLDGRIHYLGAGEQVVTASGEYQGNWFERDRRPPDEAIELSREIVRRAVERGYRGFAGFDAGVLPDGRVKVFDLNFRTNGSTKALLFGQGVQEAFGAPPAARLVGLHGTGTFSEMCRAAREALRRGIFVPLGTCDPTVFPGRAGSPAVSGLVLGESRGDVLANLQHLADHGLASSVSAAPASLAEPSLLRRAA